MKRIALTLLFLSFSSPIFGAEKLSLSRALSLIKESPRIQASDAMTQEAHSQKNMSSSMFYPAVTLSHGYMYTNNPVGVFSAKLQQRQFTQADFAIGALNEPDAVHHSHTRFQLAQPLLHSFTDVYNYEAAKHGYEAKKAEHQFHTQQARLEISKLYYALLTLEARNQILNEGIAQLTKLEESYSLMEAPTPATTTNFLIAQSIRLKLSAQKSGITSAHQELERLLSAHLGYPESTKWDLTDPLPNVESLELKREADALRADVKAARESILAAKAASKASQSTWGPNLDFVAGYNLYSGNYKDFDDAYDVGLQFTWPIFQGPRMSQNEKAKAQLKAAKEMERATTLEAQAKKENATTNLQARIQEYEVLKEAKEKSRQANRIAKKRYAQGTLPLFHYSESIQNWVAIQQEVVEAQRRANESFVTLKFERGAL